MFNPGRVNLKDTPVPDKYVEAVGSFHDGLSDGFNGTDEHDAVNSYGNQLELEAYSSGVIVGQKIRRQQYGATNESYAAGDVDLGSRVNTDRSYRSRYASNTYGLNDETYGDVWETSPNSL